ncbi:hypothetical protein Esti_006859 [Eimeria stiedai]
MLAQSTRGVPATEAAATTIDAATGTGLPAAAAARKRVSSSSNDKEEKTCSSSGRTSSSSGSKRPIPSAHALSGKRALLQQALLLPDGGAPLSFSSRAAKQRSSSSGGVPLYSALQRQQAAVEGAASPCGGAAECSSFLEAGRPVYSAQTRGAFHVLWNPYMILILCGFIGAIVGLGAWCIIASYAYKGR